MDCRKTNSGVSKAVCSASEHIEPVRGEESILNIGSKSEYSAGTDT